MDDLIYLRASSIKDDIERSQYAIKSYAQLGNIKEHKIDIQVDGCYHEGLFNEEDMLKFQSIVADAIKRNFTMYKNNLINLQLEFKNL